MAPLKTKAQLIKHYDSKLQARARAAEERLAALEESFMQVAIELDETKRALRDAQKQGNTPVYQRPPDCVPLADSARYKGGFKVPSSKGTGEHVVSFDTAVGYWVCSCPAARNRGDCPHLRAHGRPGRLAGKQLLPHFVAPPGGAGQMPARFRRPVRQFAHDREV